MNLLLIKFTELFSLVTHNRVSQRQARWLSVVLVSMLILMASLALGVIVPESAALANQSAGG